MYTTNAINPEKAIDRSVADQPPAEEDLYFEQNPAPEYLPEFERKLSDFLSKNGTRKIAVVTSGGTTVPLENNTVRFIDNFSAGTRGATSAEYFLENGYAVVFLHRQFSLLPYSRHYTHSTNCFLDYMVESETEPGSVKVDEKYQVQMLSVLRKYKQAQKDNTLLLLPFTTVTQYLFSLRCIALTMSKLHVDTRCVFYLAAAVSDFFMPTSRLPQHKIQSSGGELVVNLDPVPKFLKRLVEAWAPRVMIVSFKLETDESILESKAKTALERYNHQLVIGNLLQTRKKEVIFVTLEETEKYSLTDDEEKEGKEIEEVIVPEVIKRHEVWQEKVSS